VGALIVIAIAIVMSYGQCGRWLPALAETLLCEQHTGVADAVVIDNVQPNYLLFERAQRIQADGLARLVLLPIPAVLQDGTPSDVYVGFMEVMCRIARVAECTPFTAPGYEPISLTVAEGVARESQLRGVRSILLVSSKLRSRRTEAIFKQVLDRRGVRVLCQPVAGTYSTRDWFKTTHGVQDFVLQFGKLWYYRLCPRLTTSARLSASAIRD
jgi:hypothetical protein